jgi:hypothetical protein
VRVAVRGGGVRGFKGKVLEGEWRLRRALGDTSGDVEAGQCLDGGLAGRRGIGEVECGFGGSDDGDFARGWGEGGVFEGGEGCCVGVRWWLARGDRVGCEGDDGVAGAVSFEGFRGGRREIRFAVVALHH